MKNEKKKFSKQPNDSNKIKQITNKIKNNSKITATKNKYK